jgi:hypothetical protein
MCLHNHFIALKYLSVDGTFARENPFIRPHEVPALKELLVDVLKYAA